MLFCVDRFQDRGNMLFKQVHEGKSLKGRSNDAIASACLYIACRQEGVPRTFKGNKRSDQTILFTCSLSRYPAVGARPVIRHAAYFC